MAYGVSGIGLDPLGMGINYFGQYGSYDNYMPSMYGMNPGMMYDPSGACGMYGMNGMNGMYGMYGMMNPAYMVQMQNQAEAMQLQHAGNMHGLMLQNDVRATRETDKALIEKMLTNASVMSLMRNLVYKVQRGELDGVCNEYDKLKDQIYHTYGEEIAARGNKENPAVAARDMIEELYAQVTSANGQPSTLLGDIQRYGESSFVNGYKQAYKPGHDGRYTAEALNHIYGTDISNIEANEGARSFGKVAGRAAHGGKMGLYAGGTVGAATLITALGATPFSRKAGWAVAKRAPKIALITAGIAAIADIVSPGCISKLFGKTAEARV